MSWALTRFSRLSRASSCRRLEGGNKIVVFGEAGGGAVCEKVVQMNRGD